MFVNSLVQGKGKEAAFRATFLMPLYFIQMPFSIPCLHLKSSQVIQFTFRSNYGVLCLGCSWCLFVFSPSVYCFIILCLELKDSREKVPPLSFVITVDFLFSLLSPPFYLAEFSFFPCLLSATWGRKLRREYSSTSNVFWSLTKANCLLLLPRLEIPSEMKFHPAPALSEWGTANFFFQQKGAWEQVAPFFSSSICTWLFHASAFFQRTPDNVPSESLGSWAKNSIKFLTIEFCLSLAGEK